ncbi:site-specific integrase [Pigmentiphaga aceris]|uniref:Site-specific integrase n=1 Tax=Pigmentiphaga aceris TaxID=1940612 RepID=A0A5C0AXC9_9BURK|nr:site-specific integrase [Pigmentiphaga aceris]QEI06785.1 site-specific integrase [Pigmentiphaga aceris]
MTLVIADATPHLAPIETTVLPRALDGSQGANRAVGTRAQISATNDPDAIKAWLARFVDSPTTFSSYRKEAERLLWWSVLECGKPLSGLNHEDLLAYQNFLRDPQPAARWCMPNGRKFGRLDAGWRPFSGPLSASSQRQAIVILNTLFSWLVNAGYLAGNPLSLSRQRRRRAEPRIVRYLDDASWQVVKDSIASAPPDDLRAVRVRWLFSLLYICGLRVSEVAANDMGGFFSRVDRTGETRWWLEILGKGDKLRLVPATSELMQELARYRRQLGLSALPQLGETLPLLLPLGGEPRQMTRAALHAVIKQVFADAADSLLARNPAAVVQAGRIRAASAHWLRHTAGSAMASGDMDLRHVRDNLGHESIATTSRYLHAEDDHRHAETERGHRLSWPDTSAGPVSTDA